MPDILSTGLSGLQAFQRALEVTGHNIANVNTEGYSRQVSQFAARDALASGAGYIGTGTQITTVKRAYDDIIGTQLQSSTSSYARFEAMTELSGRLDSLLADPSTGLNAQLQNFFGAVQDIANDPASLPTRQALLGEADGLVLRFKDMHRQLTGIETELNQRVTATVDEINSLASEIATLNDQIVIGSGAAGGQPPNDLLDRRDLVIRQLSELVSVSTVPQDDGSMNVFIGSGQNLVTGNQASTMTVRSSEFDPTRLEVSFQGVNGDVPIGNDLTGGRLGGLMEFREQVLDPTRRAIGETAQAIAITFNEQHMSGLDLYGNLGGEFFSIDGPAVLTSNQNTGTGTASASIDDIGALAGTDYLLNYDGAAYSLVRTDNGQAVTMTGSGTAADPFRADGLSIVVGGAPAAGDRLRIQPVSTGAGSIERSLNDPQALAMAAPTRTTAALDNIGNGEISASSVVDRNDPALLDPVTIEFLDATTYSINGAGSFAYTAGDPIIVNGNEFAITGQPQAGDSFTMERNVGASGDNRNGLLLADVQTVGILKGGTVSINESYGQLIGIVGSSSRQMQANFEAQGVVLANAESALLSKAGVNLDEEAANMLKFQQAYQAAAQIITVASQMFDTLLNATRR